MPHTKTFSSGNTALVAFVNVNAAGKPQIKIDIVWTKYPPSPSDVDECTAWVNTMIPNAKVTENRFDEVKPDDPR